jgi:phenylacetate-coenzyme A ligase PaaK-like adenylate-forming protein
MHQIELFMKYPHDVQEEWLQRLLKQGSNTRFGKRFGMIDIQNREDFVRRIPLQDYESLKGDIDKMRKGEPDVLWPGETKYFAKSSGTTGDKSKFIPLTDEALDGCHYNGGRDMVTFYCINYPETRLFTGKNLALAGSRGTYRNGGGESYYGDLSALVISHLPLWAEFFRAPELSIALMDNWEEKLEKLARSTMEENITSLAGVPSWMLVLLKRILEIKKTKTLEKIWPSLEVYFHGGVNFEPYRKQFSDLFPGNNLRFLELYNASEGFFGIQDQKEPGELLLMLDYGIYYEFIPPGEWENPEAKTLSLMEVKPGIDYSLVITTNAGLWRYRIGDTIRFTSTHPYRFVISGRTKQFLNVFGEEVMVHNVEHALQVACQKTDAIVAEFSVGPVFMDEGKAGAHEWVLEFEKEPADLAYFTALLDNALKSLNSDYEAKRFNDYALREPIVRTVEKGTFFEWMKHRGRLGGQNKVPRLSNDRKYIEEILKFNRK